MTLNESPSESFSDIFYYVRSSLVEKMRREDRYSARELSLEQAAIIIEALSTHIYIFYKFRFQAIS
jgi:hypothetical protein